MQLHNTYNIVYYRILDVDFLFEKRFGKTHPVRYYYNHMAALIYTVMIIKKSITPTLILGFECKALTDNHDHIGIIELCLTILWLL